MGLGFGIYRVMIQGSGFRVYIIGVCVQDGGFRVQSLRFMIQNSELLGLWVLSGV